MGRFISVVSLKANLCLETDNKLYCTVLYYVSFLELTPLPRPSRCLLYTSDAADEVLRVDLGGRRIIK